MKKHLIITSAHIEDETRIRDYKTSFDSVKNLYNNLDNIFILETISKNNLDYLENNGFITYYSEMSNDHTNKGYNQFNHLTNFLKNNETIENEDIVIMLTGRYHLLNDNMFKLIDENMILKNFKIMAKDDGDIYPPGFGVHTFFICFKKQFFLNFFEWYLDVGDHFKCIEHELKRYMELKPNESFVIPKNFFLGVKINQVNGYKNIDV